MDGAGANKVKGVVDGLVKGKSFRHFYSISLDDTLVLLKNFLCELEVPSGDSTLPFIEAGIPVIVFMATQKDNYRKPSSGMWEWMKCHYAGESINLASLLITFGYLSSVECPPF